MSPRHGWRHWGAGRPRRPRFFCSAQSFLTWFDVRDSVTKTLNSSLVNSNGSRLRWIATVLLIPFLLLSGQLVWSEITEQRRQIERHAERLSGAERDIAHTSANLKDVAQLLGALNTEQRRIVEIIGQLQSGQESLQMMQREVIISLRELRSEVAANRRRDQVK